MSYPPLGALLGALALLHAPGSSTEDVEALVRRLHGELDAADPELVLELADQASPQALDGLIEAYDRMGSLYMRRFVLQAVAEFDEVPKLGPIALQKLTDVATLSADHELRLFAVEQIADCEHLGRTFLQRIVDSQADQDVRLASLELHIAQARDADSDWYRSIYELVGEGEEVEDEAPRRPSALRAAAFDAIAEGLGEEQLLTASEDPERRIRLRALVELDVRDNPLALELAEELYELRRLDPLERRPADQLVGARILARRLGTRVAERFLEDAVAAATKTELSLGLAEILAGFGDKGIDKRLLRQLGKGKPKEKLFSMWACRDMDDPKVARTLIKLLKDGDRGVQFEAMSILAQRGERAALEDLEELVDRSKSFDVIERALATINDLRAGEAEWEQRLRGYVLHEDLGIRNGALRALGNLGHEQDLPLLFQALEHEHWSTRLSAARALEAVRKPGAVGALCRRIDQERGRPQAEMAQILFRMTGQPFRTNGKLWEHWWEEQGDTFEFPSPEEFAALEAQDELRFLKEVSRTKEERRVLSRAEQRFFGVRVDSLSVIFILDVSRSMLTETRSGPSEEPGPSRIELAKRELLRGLESLHPNSLFNIILFSGEVDAWSERMEPCTDEVLERAVEFAQGIRAWGGTNLYGALKLAFDQAEVDSIYLLSDGEPSLGDLVDPMAIRKRVQIWNEHRGIRINCVAIGNSLDALRWLAQDSGGAYLEYR